jgi:ornithine cyclodeaminase
MHLAPVRSFTEEQVRERLRPAEVIAVIEAAFRDRLHSAVIPVRSQMNLADGVFLVMPCYDRTGQVLGMKLATVQKQPETPQGRVQATYMLLDSRTARPALVVPANYLTDLRTAATSAVATKFLARKEARVLGIFGTGRQARAHIEVLPLVRQFTRVLVCGREPGASRDFAKTMARETDLRIEAADARTCAGESDVICTCTTSPTPLFDGGDLRSGVHLNLVGAFQPQTREVDSTTVHRAHVFVETYDGVLAESGDLLIPIQEGRFHRDQIAGDLHQLANGQGQGRLDDDAITLFKSVGHALEDLVTAELLFG